MTADYREAKKRKATNVLLVKLTSRETLDEVVVEYPRGHSRREDITQLVRAKFEENVRGWFDEERAIDILKYADMDLEEFLDMNVSDFMDAMVSPDRDV